MKIESPIYRFEKFDKNWLFVKISDLASQFKTGGTPSTKEPTFWGGSIPWIQSSDIQKDILFGVIPQKFISEEGLQNSSAKLIPKNSIAIVTRVGVGKLAIIDQDYATSQDFLSLSDLNGDTQFIVYSIYRILQKESAQLQGTSIKGITKEDLLSKKISLPEFDEQSAIGALFRTVDDLLASCKDNLANYQSLKATMLSKMFPKPGQTLPEIRLDGFDGEWGKYYLGDIFEQVSNYIEPSVENELWSLTVEKGLTPKTDRYKRDFLVKKNDKFKKVDVNEFVYNPMNLTLGALDLNDNEVTISVSGYYVVMKNRDIEKFDNDFLKILLKTTYAIYQYKQFATGTLIEKQRVQFPTFSEIPFYLPPIAEQQAIGSYFSNIDNIINSHQEKITQLETLKKKLLQDMFV
ncbi:restriction endonuclease subunit S [Streptococcus sp. 343_SSPC]|uniref:restriction endonuclease subunit S n=1 Tax=Streptococcus sp. 343_SSPC TaxID=1579342 RepID=UPI000660EDB4|nr:restriction endonuclease subunit S [Streptococcus sp. 343_SSPC]